MKRKKIYSNEKKYYLKLKEEKTYNIMDIYVEVDPKLKSEWTEFVSNYLEHNYKLRKVSNINSIMLKDILYYLDKKEVVLLVRHLMDFQNYNPNTDTIPVQDIHKVWKQRFEKIIMANKERTKYFISLHKNMKNVVTKEEKLVLFLDVEDKKFKNLPFEEFPFLDLYIHYDNKNKSIVIKSNPFMKKRIDLNPYYDLINNKFPNLFYKHGANYFIKNEKGKKINKKTYQEIIKIIEEK